MRGLLAGDDVDLRAPALAAAGPQLRAKLPGPVAHRAHAQAGAGGLAGAGTEAASVVADAQQDVVPPGAEPHRDVASPAVADSVCDRLPGDPDKLVAIMLARL